MKIAIDVDAFGCDGKSGVYYYLQRLLQAYLPTASLHEHELVYFGTRRRLEDFGLPPRSAAIRCVRWFPRKLYQLSLRTPFGLPFDLVSRTTADVFVFTGFVRWPLWRHKPSMVFIYDTVYLDRPDTIRTRRLRWYLSRAVPRTISKATRVITISNHARHQLIKHYGVPAERVRVITPAVDHSVFAPAPAAEIERVRSRYGIARPYVLCVGTLEPRKNLIGLVRAFAAAPRDVRDVYALVLAGGNGWSSQELNRICQELGSRITILKTGYVPMEDLPALYSGAAVFVFPSLYEGFGIPPLEAMACGTPVITSDNSSLPEVTGDAGIQVGAHDTVAISEAITRVLRDPQLADDMRVRGLRQAQRFTWASEAAKFKNLLEEVGRASTEPIC